MVKKDNGHCLVKQKIFPLNSNQSCQHGHQKDFFQSAQWWIFSAGAKSFFPGGQQW